MVVSFTSLAAANAVRVEARRYAAVGIEGLRDQGVGFDPSVESVERYAERVAIERARLRGGVGGDGVAQVLLGELEADDLLHVGAAGERAAQFQQTGRAVGVAQQRRIVGNLS